MSYYRGVKFGKYHTAIDWGMLLNKSEIDPPKPKMKMVKLDGRDGELDLTEALGGVVRYENRTLEFKFLLIDGGYEERLEVIADVYAKVHGKRLEILLDDDQDFYFVGRCQVKSAANNASMGEIKIEVDADPYRYKIVDTVRAVAVKEEAQTCVCQNLGVKRVVPKITVTGNITLTFNEIVTTLTDGTYEINTIQFDSGFNYITVSGTGTVVFTFREGRF